MNVEDKKLDAPEEYDLEDGEIDDDDDDEPSTCLNSKSESTDKNESSQNKDQKSSLVSIDLTANENTINKVANYNEREDECDDFADNLEKTMAAMLKKDGIVPKIPEIVLEKRKRIKEEEAMAAKESALSKNSRSSRRRKSRKAQKEKDREKELDKVSNFSKLFFFLFNLREIFYIYLMMFLSGSNSTNIYSISLIHIKNLFYF